MGYAEIETQLFTNEIDLSEDILAVELMTSNQGNLAITPTYKVSVENATIVDVEIDDIQKQYLSEYCQIEINSVTISNIKILGGCASFVFATINIIPNEDALQIGISSYATLLFDILHPKNKVLHSFCLGISD
ncbi:MAG: hypothetical protein P8Y18_12140 [Candidatus Bathyarchaeota archaeon]